MTNGCFMISENLDGGGNVLAESSIVIRRTAAVGDSLSATVVADRLIEQGFAVTMQSHSACHCVLRRHRGLIGVAEPNGFAHVDLDGAYERDPLRRTKHFSTMWFERAQEQLRGRGIELGQPVNCRPSISLLPNEVAAAKARLEQHPRPWVMICPRSDAYACRQVPDGIWAAAASKMQGTKFWIGRHPGPAGIVDLQCRHLDMVVFYLSAADLLVSVDTGPMHIAAALGVPVVALGQSSTPELHLSDQRDFITLEPKGLNCLNCQANLCPLDPHMPPCQKFDPDFIASWVNARLGSIFGDHVSALVSIYKPEVGRLNHCLENVLQQPEVAEIIVCRDEHGILPAGVMSHPKIRFVKKAMRDVGYGRKQNFAARQSNGKWLLLINPDCYLNESAVRHMLDAMKADPRVGIVAPLLRYPGGDIYHAGKIRAPNTKGWGHINHRQFHHDFKDVTELENVCGACMLVRREAFYRAQCFDEEVYLYTEDDRLCLSVRREGYRVLFTPHATGIHEEGEATRQTPNVIDIMNRSNADFGRKWGQYFSWNATRLPLGNFDYLKQ